MLKHLADKLYSSAPASILYHYTSLNGLLGIVKTRALWASDIRYLNDSEELRNFAGYIAIEVLKRREKNEQDIHILEQFRDWFAVRASSGSMIFVGSFTENGNLLSQWRGYCPYGKGVSIGFEPELLVTTASHASFSVGRCIYERDDHELLAHQVIDFVSATAMNYTPPKNVVERWSHHGLFQVLEPDLLRIAALTKNSSFKEEREWRFISPVLDNYVETPIEYREGRFSLIPHLNMPLPTNSNGALAIRRTVVGPTPNPNLSVDAVCRFLSKQGVAPNEVGYSAIPYRQG